LNTIVIPLDKQSSAWLEVIVNGSPVPTFVINSTHIVTHWNRACEVVTGTLAVDVVGTTDAWKTFYPDKLKRPVMADLIVDRRLESHIGSVYYGKYRPSKIIPGSWEATDFFPHFPDNGKWLSFSASALYDQDGMLVGAIETLQDITEHKMHELANQKLVEFELRKSSERKVELDAIAQHHDLLLLPKLWAINALSSSLSAEAGMINEELDHSTVRKATSMINEHISQVTTDIEELLEILRAVK